MKRKRKIKTHDDCPICGDTVEVLTSAEQSCPCPGGRGNCGDHSGYWWAEEQDDAICPGCGAKGQVIIDGDEAHISIDQSIEHNLKCAAKYVAES
jgi:Zn finger protein HypA/HybF involved in hydrogenase expression